MDETSTSTGFDDKEKEARDIAVIEEQEKQALTEFFIKKSLDLVLLEDIKFKIKLTKGIKMDERWNGAALTG